MARQREVLVVPGCLPQGWRGADQISAEQWRPESHRDGLDPTPERFGGARAEVFEAGEGPHGRSVQAPCSPDSPILFYRESWRKEELLSKFGTQHEEEVASMPFECLRTLRQIVANTHGS